MMFAEKKSETLRDIRQVACNCCGQPVPKAEAVRRQKGGDGDLLLWKPECWKRVNRKKVKLVKGGG